MTSKIRNRSACARGSAEARLVVPGVASNCKTKTRDGLAPVLESGDGSQKGTASRK